MTQGAHIFSGCVRDNNTLFEDPNEIYHDKLHNALLCTGIGEQFLSRVEGGLAADVGERGNNLSGRQRQRIAIARALYRDPAILILDEATNGLERNAQIDILRALKSQIRDKIMIIISHDPSVYSACDSVIDLGG